MKKKTRNKLFISVGAFLACYYIILTAIMGSITFSKYLLFGGILLLLFPSIDKLLQSNKTYLLIYKIIRPLFYIGISIFFITEIIIIGYSFQNNFDAADYTIVLGAGVRGETMTVTLKQRVDKALEYIQNEGENGYLVLSGGQGRGESITEAEAIKRYLIKNGVNQDKILKEEKSTDTYENLEYSKRIIEEHSGKAISELKVKIVTSNFHLFRAKVLSSSLGYKNITLCGSPIWPIFIPTYYIREFIGFYKMLVFDILLK